MALTKSGWLTPAYVTGLVLVFAGERVFATTDEVRFALSGLGVALALFATVARFIAAAREDGERRRAETSLARLSLGGLLALGLYFATTDMGKKLLGVAEAAPPLRARIEGAATVAWIALLLVSVVPLLFGERALGPMRRAARIEGRRVEAATVAGLTLALAALYTTLATYATGELETKVDFSYYRTARPSESTKNVAASLTEPVKVMAFFPQLNEVGGEVEGYLRDLGAGPNLQIELHDRLLVPSVAKEAKVTQDGVIVLTKGTSRETVSVGSEMKTSAAKLKSLDGDFQKSLIKLLRAQRTAYLTVGHGELNEPTGEAAAEGRSGKSLKKLIESQNYAVKDLGLSQGLANDVPADATMVLVMGPTQKLLPEEIASLERYASKGGKLFLALDPDAKLDLAPLAEIVDVTWQSAVLASDKNFVPRRRNASDHVNIVTNRFSSHASVSTLSRANRAPVIFVSAAALDKKQGTETKIDFSVRTLSDVFADLDGNFELGDGTEKRNTYNVMAAVNRPAVGAEGDKGKASAPSEMRAVVTGDVDAFSDGVLTHDPNVVLFLDAVRWLGGEESFSGAVATTEDVRLEHTKDKDLVWFYGTIFAAPLLVLGAGLAYSRRASRSRAPAPTPGPVERTPATTERLS